MTEAESLKVGFKFQAASLLASEASGNGKPVLWLDSQVSATCASLLVSAIEALIHSQGEFHNPTREQVYLHGGREA